MTRPSLHLVNGHTRGHDVLDYLSSALDVTLYRERSEHFTMKSTLVDVKASPIFRDSCGVLAYDNEFLVYFCFAHV